MKHLARSYWMAFSLVLALALTGCGGGGGGGGGGNNQVAQPPTAPTAVAALAENGDGTVTVRWNAAAGAASYNLYWAPANSVDMTTGTKISGVTSPYTHTGVTDGQVYAYLVSAANVDGETPAAAVTSATPRAPRLTGSAALPDLHVSYVNGLPGGGFDSVCLYDLTWQLAGDQQDYCAATEVFDFQVARDEAYILLAEWAGGQALAALVPPVARDTVRAVDLNSEVAMNVVVVLEREFTPQFDSGDLTGMAPRLADLTGKADELVGRLDAFYLDRNTNRDADRYVEAVRAFTLDRLNQGRSVDNDSLVQWMIRSYGGGVGAVRTMDNMLSDPLPPYNPHFLFERYTGGNTLNVAMSDTAKERWDYLFDDAFSPHMAVGGDQIVFTAPNGTVTNGGFKVFGLYIKTMGQDDRRLLTPPNLMADDPAISPDQTRIAFGGYVVDTTSLENTTGGIAAYQLYVVNADGTGLTAITNNTETSVLDPDVTQGNLGPDWSPDGQLLVFHRWRFDLNPDGSSGWYESKLETIAPDGSNRQEFINFATNVQGWLAMRHPKWSPDGSQILFESFVSGTSGIEPDLEILAVDYPIDAGANFPSITRFTNNDNIKDAEASYSYDGRFIVFCSSRGGEPKNSLGFDVQPIYVLNRYTQEVTDSLGDFTSAEYYGSPTFIATEAVLNAVAGVTTNTSGDAVITGTDSRTTTGGGSSSSSTYNYYREIIPAANSSGINFNVTSWF